MPASGTRASSVDAAVRQLDAGERVGSMSLVAHEREIAHVVVVPDALGDDRPVVGVEADEGLLRADSGPASLGLHPPEARLRAGLLAPNPVQWGTW